MSVHGTAVGNSSEVRGQASPSASGAGAADDLFALTDEQILEIEPEGGAARQSSALDDMELLDGADSAAAHGTARGAADDAAHGGGDGLGDAAAAASARNDSRAASGEHAAEKTPGQAKSVANGTAQPATLGAEPPQWLAEMMNDPRASGEARDLWNGVQQARQEAAAFREVFAKPEEARSAAERARQLDEIDRSYFAGDAAERSRLAATMLREDPVAFREMVFAGLRALEEAGKSGGLKANAGRESPLAETAAVADASTAARRTEAHLETSAANGAAKSGEKTVTAENARIKEYAAFEKSANEELERSVGGAIERTLEQALPATARGGAQQGSALQQKLGVAIRQDVEKALQGDRQLGEQVGQILSSRRLDNETRTQLVRLIGERARQLVPGAAKKVLGEWTQTTIASHRARSGRVDGAAARQEVAATAGHAGAAANQSQGQSQNRPSSASTKLDRGERRGVDYRRLSDEQILEM